MHSSIPEILQKLNRGRPLPKRGRSAWFAMPLLLLLIPVVLLVMTLTVVVVLGLGVARTLGWRRQRAAHGSVDAEGRPVQAQSPRRDTGVVIDAEYEVLR